MQATLDALPAPRVAAENIDSDSRFRLSLSDFSKSIHRGYTHTPYQQLIDTYLEQVALYIATDGREGLGRVMFFAPPRHGKTLKVSRLFPAWLMGTLPSTRMIMASYAVTLAKKNSRFVRNLIRSEPYRRIFPNVRLARDTASATEWDIDDTGGGLFASGVVGGTAGHGAKLIGIDDPIKNRAQAESPTYREHLKDWFTDDILTRLDEPGGAIIVMNTRWHQDDLSGWLLGDEYASDWTVVNLPALAGANDPLGRAEGVSLWPERYGVELLNKRRERMGEYSFASLYQQSPLPSGGGLFDAECIRVIDYIPECLQVVRFYDLAVTAKRSADYTVGLKLGLLPDEEFVVLDIWRGQKEFPDVQAAIVQNAAIDGAKVRIFLEAEKAGIIGLQQLLRLPEMRPFSVNQVTPQGDKYSRALPVAARVNARRVLMVRAAWNRAFLDELSVFGGHSAHDDQVDAFSGAYTNLSRPRTCSSVW